MIEIDGEITMIGGGTPRQTDVPHLASQVVAVDSEIIAWLQAREAKRRRQTTWFTIISEDAVPMILTAGPGLTDRQLALLIAAAKPLCPEKRTVLAQRLIGLLKLAVQPVDDSAFENALRTALQGLKQKAELHT
jgi:hypothetical protein